MKTRRTNPLVMFTFFVLCLVTWIVVQVELGGGRLSYFDIFWVIAFLIMVYLFRGRVRNSRKPLEREELTDPAEDS